MSIFSVTAAQSQHIVAQNQFIEMYSAQSCSTETNTVRNRWLTGAVNYAGLRSDHRTHDKRRFAIACWLIFCVLCLSLAEQVFSSLSSSSSSFLCVLCNHAIIYDYCWWWPMRSGRSGTGQASFSAKAQPSAPHTNTRTF